MPPFKKSSCPKCNGDMLRKSHWKSHEEKHTQRGQFPYRCISCGHRFLGPEKGKHTLLFSGLGLAATLMMMIIALVAKNQGHVGLNAGNAQGRNHVTEAHLAITSETIEAATSGDVDAQYRLGRNKLLEAAYDASKGTEAVLWLTQAAEGGHSGAMTRLGRMYQSGVGVLQNYDLTVLWLRRAAHKGDPAGMLEYGRLFRDGIAVEKDLIQAYVWMNRASAANNATAVREREAISLMLEKSELRQAQRLSAEPPSEPSKHASNHVQLPIDKSGEEAQAGGNTPAGPTNGS